MITNQNKTPLLTILLWNANGLNRNKNKLHYLLNEKLMKKILTLH